MSARTDLSQVLTEEIERAPRCRGCHRPATRIARLHDERDVLVCDDDEHKNHLTYSIEDLPGAWVTRAVMRIQNESDQEKRHSTSVTAYGSTYRVGSDVSAIAQFIASSSLSSSSAKEYERQLLLLDAFLREHRQKCLLSASRSDLDAWINQLQQRYAPASVRRQVSILRSFYRHRSPSELPTAPPKVKCLSIDDDRSITEERFQRLMAACDQSDRGIRDAAIITVVMRTRLHLRQVAALTKQSIAVERVIQARRMTFLLDDESWRRIMAWTYVREKWLGSIPNTPEHLFLSSPSMTPMCRSSISQLIKRACARADMQKLLVARRFRRS